MFKVYFINIMLAPSCLTIPNGTPVGISVHWTWGFGLVPRNRDGSPSAILRVPLWVTLVLQPIGSHLHVYRLSESAQADGRLVHLHGHSQ